MRNLFKECGYSQFDIEDKVMSCWNTIFDQRSAHRLYFETTDSMGYVEDTGNDDARTEGMSYGMMMAVEMNRKDVFDRIWKWAKTYMYLESGANAGFFCWSNQLDGTKNSEGPAPDGEEYFAAALKEPQNYPDVKSKKLLILDMDGQKPGYIILQQE